MITLKELSSEIDFILDDLTAYYHKKKSLRKVGKALSVTRTTIWCWIKRKYPPSIPNLLKIKQLLEDQKNILGGE